MTLTPQGGKRSPSAYLPLSTLSPRETWSLSENEEEEREEEEEEEPIIGNKILIYQYTALICACLIGTGSHFANHTIGPLKPYLKEVSLTPYPLSFLLTQLTAFYQFF